MNLTLRLKLLSDTTFGRGDGMSGLVDQEIEHDPTTGLPFVRGRTLKGLLVEECANILYGASRVQRLEDAARMLFGRGGSDLRSGGVLHVGNAEVLPSLKEVVQCDIDATNPGALGALLVKSLKEVVQCDIDAKRLQPSDVLDIFTSIRRQTAINEETGTPDKNSLRASRVLLRKTELYAPLEIALHNDDPILDDALALLCACTAGLRRGGTGRNRGRGRLEAWLEGERLDEDLVYFEQLVKGNRS